MVSGPTTFPDSRIRIPNQPALDSQLAVRVASDAGSAFMQGIVLYDGVQTLSFADNLRAVPLSALWA